MEDVCAVFSDEGGGFDDYPLKKNVFPQISSGSDQTLKRQRQNSQAAATKLSSGSDVISLLPACFGGVAVDYLFICRRGDAFCYEEFFCCDELEAVFEELRDCLTDSLDSFFVSGSVMH